MANFLFFLFIKYRIRIFYDQRDNDRKEYGEKEKKC